MHRLHSNYMYAYKNCSLQRLHWDNFVGSAMCHVTYQERVEGRGQSGGGGHVAYLDSNLVFNLLNCSSIQLLRRRVQRKHVTPSQSVLVCACVCVRGGCYLELTANSLLLIFSKVALAFSASFLLISDMFSPNLASLCSKVSSWASAGRWERWSHNTETESKP